MTKQLQELDVERDGIGEEVEQDVRQSQDPIAVAAPTRQPAKADDLTADERFRKWQAEYDRKLAQERKERQRLEAQYQQQLAERERALREQQLAGMDDYQRAQYEREEARKEAEYWRQQAAVIQSQTAREKALLKIANKASVPVDVLQEAESEGHAWELAWDYQRQQEQEQARQREWESEEKRAQREEAKTQKRQANRVDTGAGAPPSSASEFDAKLKKAKESGSALELAKLLYSSGS